jgi:hypothetical protein
LSTLFVVADFVWPARTCNSQQMPSSAPTAAHTADLIARTHADLNGLAANFYFHPDTIAVGKEHDLDGFRFYVLGRGGVLGNVEAAVVTSAFGWWNPELIEKMWTTAQYKMAPRDAGRLYMTCAQSYGRARLGNVTGLAQFCAAAEAVVHAANPAGLALFAGIAAEPLADDLPARAYQLMVVLRELRGSAHLVAVLAQGLEPRLAHAGKRPDMIKAFGWGEEPIPVTADEQAALAAAESLTDQLVAPAFSVLSQQDAAEFITGLANIKAALIEA